MDFKRKIHQSKSCLKSLFTFSYTVISYKNPLCNQKHDLWGLTPILDLEGELTLKIFFYPGAQKDLIPLKRGKGALKTIF